MKYIVSDPAFLIDSETWNMIKDFEIAKLREKLVEILNLDYCYIVPLGRIKTNNHVNPQQQSQIYKNEFFTESGLICFCPIQGNLKTKEFSHKLEDLWGWAYFKGSDDTSQMKVRFNRRDPLWTIIEIVNMESGEVFISDETPTSAL